MTAIAVVLAIGILIAVFAYMAFKFKSEDNSTNAVWKVLCMVVLVLLLDVLAWSISDANQVCSIVADNESSTGNLICIAGPMNQGPIVLKLMLLVTTIFFIWLCISLFIMAINHLRSTGKL